MKQEKTIWSKLTISDFNDAKVILDSDNKQDWAGLLDVFGYDINKLSASELMKLQNQIDSSVPQPSKLKRFYILNGTRYNISVNLSTLSAGQFIDWQVYKDKNVLENLLSVFLIPSKFFIFKQKYGSYDMQKVQSDILNYMTYEDAIGLIFFLVTQSTQLFKTTEKYLTHQIMKKELKKLKDHK